jgi:chemotaxis signal transduction protein
MRRDDETYLDVTIDKSHFLFPVCEVEEVAEMLPLHPYPLTLSRLLGVVNLRGQVIPVVSVPGFSTNSSAAGFSRLIVTRVGEALFAFACTSVKKLVLKEEQMSEIRAEKVTMVDGGPSELLTASAVLAEGIL